MYTTTAKHDDKYTPPLTTASVSIPHVPPTPPVARANTTQRYAHPEGVQRYTRRQLTTRPNIPPFLTPTPRTGVLLYCKSSRMALARVSYTNAPDLPTSIYITYEPPPPHKPALSSPLPKHAFLRRLCGRGTTRTLLIVRRPCGRRARPTSSRWNSNWRVCTPEFA